MNEDLPSINDFIEDRSNLPTLNESVESDLPSYKDFIEERGDDIVVNMDGGVGGSWNVQETPEQQTVIREQTIIKEVQDNSAIISLIEQVRDSIPEVKSYDKELFELVTLIEEVRKEIPVVPEPPEIPEIPEVKYYDDEISQLQESIEQVKGRDIPDFRWISKSFTSINEDYESVSSSLAQLKGKLELEVNNLLETLEVNKFEASTDSKSIRSTLDSKIETNDQMIREDVKRIKDKIYDNLRETSLKIWNLNREYKKEDKELKKQIGEQYNTLRDAIIAAVDSSDQKLDENYSKINKYFDGLREEVRSLPEVKYYDDQIDKVNESVKSIENLVEVLENKLNKKIAALKESILVVPPSENNTDPLTPLDQNFATLDDLSSHYRLFLNRIQEQLATLGGGGEVRLEFLDDVDRDTAKVDGKFLKYQSSTGKWVGDAGTDLSETQIFTGGIAEKFQTGTTLAADNTLALSDGNVIRRTSNESGNQTVNFTGVHSKLSNGEVVSFTVIITPNGSGVINAVQIDGQTITINWSGGSVPSAGSSGKDVYTFSVFKTGTGVSDYEVYGAATNYA